MEENEKVDPGYVKRFNDGYLLAKHEPELASQVLQDAGSLENKGLKDGIEEFRGEKKKDLTPSWLKKDRPSTPDKDESKDYDLDKD